MSSPSYPPIIRFGEHGAVSFDYLLQHPANIDFAEATGRGDAPFIKGLFDPSNHSDYAISFRAAQRRISDHVTHDKSMQALLKLPHWDETQRAQWEQQLSTIVSAEVNKEKLFDKYRTENEQNDLNKLTLTSEYDCDSMAATEGLLLQLTENRFLTTKTDFYKSPSSYYFFSNYTSDVLDLLGQAKLGPHAAIISSKTANVIEATNDPDNNKGNPYRHRFPPDGKYDFASFIAGEPLITVNHDDMGSVIIYSPVQCYDANIASLRSQELKQYPDRSPTSMHPKAFTVDHGEQRVETKGMVLESGDLTPVNLMGDPLFQRIWSHIYQVKMQIINMQLSNEFGASITADNLVAALQWADESASSLDKQLYKQCILTRLVASSSTEKKGSIQSYDQLIDYINNRSELSLLNRSDGVIDQDELGKIIAAGYMLGQHVTVVQNVKGQDRIEFEDDRHHITFKVKLNNDIKSLSV